MAPSSTISPPTPGCGVGTADHDSARSTCVAVGRPRLDVRRAPPSAAADPHPGHGPTAGEEGWGGSRGGWVVTVVTPRLSAVTTGLGTARGTGSMREEGAIGHGSGPAGGVRARGCGRIGRGGTRGGGAGPGGASDPARVPRRSCRWGRVSARATDAENSPRNSAVVRAPGRLVRRALRAPGPRRGLLSASTGRGCWESGEVEFGRGRYGSAGGGGVGGPGRPWGPRGRDQAWCGGSGGGGRWRADSGGGLGGVRARRRHLRPSGRWGRLLTPGRAAAAAHGGSPLALGDFRAGPDRAVSGVSARTGSRGVP